MFSFPEAQGAGTTEEESKVLDTRTERKSGRDTDVSPGGGSDLSTAPPMEASDESITSFLMNSDDIAMQFEVSVESPYPTLEAWQKFAQEGQVLAPPSLARSRNVYCDGEDHADRTRLGGGPDPWDQHRRVRVTRVDTEIRISAQPPSEVTAVRDEMTKSHMTPPFRTPPFDPLTVSVQDRWWTALPPDTGALYTEAHPGVVWPSMLSPYYIGPERPWLPKGAVYPTVSDPDEDGVLLCCYWRTLRYSLASLRRLYESGRAQVFTTFPGAERPGEPSRTYESTNATPRSTFAFPYGERTQQYSYAGLVERFGPISNSEYQRHNTLRKAKIALYGSQAVTPNWFWNLICWAGCCFPNRLRPPQHFTPPELVTLDPINASSDPKWHRRVAKQEKGVWPITMRVFNSRIVTSLRRLLRPRGNDQKSTEDVEQELADFAEGRERKGMGQGSSLVYKFKRTGLCWYRVAHEEYVPYLPAIMGGYFPLNAAADQHQTEVMSMCAGSLADMRDYRAVYDALFPDVALKEHYKRNRYLGADVPLPGSLVVPNTFDRSGLSTVPSNAHPSATAAHGSSIYANAYTESLRTKYNYYYFGIGNDPEHLRSVADSADRLAFASEYLGGPFPPHISGNCRCADCAIYPPNVIPAGYMRESLERVGALDLTQTSTVMPPHVPLSQGGDGGRSLYNLTKGRRVAFNLDNSEPKDTPIVAALRANKGQYVDISESSESASTPATTTTTAGATTEPKLGAYWRNVARPVDMLGAASPQIVTSSAIVDDDSASPYAILHHGGKTEKSNGPIEQGSHRPALSPASIVPLSDVVVEGSHVPKATTTEVRGTGADAGPRVQRQRAIRNALKGMKPLVVTPKYAEPGIFTPAWFLSWVSWVFAIIGVAIDCLYTPDTIFYYTYYPNTGPVKYAEVYFETAMYGPSFLALSPSELLKYVKNDNLAVDEFLLYQSLIRWARHRLYERGEDHADPSRVRYELREILPYVRFTLMTYAELNYLANGPPILTPEEMHFIFFLKSYTIKGSSALPELDVQTNASITPPLTIDVTRNNPISSQMAALRHATVRKTPPAPEVECPRASEYTALPFTPDADQGMKAKAQEAGATRVNNYGGAARPKHTLELESQLMASYVSESSVASILNMLFALGIADSNTVTELAKSPIVHHLHDHGVPEPRCASRRILDDLEELEDSQNCRSDMLMCFIHLCSFGTSFIPLFLIIGLFTMIGFGHNHMDMHTPKAYWAFSAIAVAILAGVAGLLFRACCSDCYASGPGDDFSGLKQCVSIDFNNDSIFCRGMELHDYPFGVQSLFALLLACVGVDALLTWLHYSGAAHITATAFFIPFYILWGVLILATIYSAHQDDELCVGVACAFFELQFLATAILWNLRAAGAVPNLNILIILSPFAPTLLLLAITGLVLFFSKHDEFDSEAYIGWIVIMATFGLFLVFLVLHVWGIDHPHDNLWKPSLAVTFVPLYPPLAVGVVFAFYIVGRQVLERDYIVTYDRPGGFLTLRTDLQRSEVDRLA